MLHKQSKYLDKMKVELGKNTYKQVLISSSDAPHFAMRKFIIDIEGHMPLHTNSIEHEQYILRGKAKIKIGNEILIVKKDDIVYIPKLVQHSYENIGNEPFEFLCIVPNGSDKIVLVK